jgi:hypothetical protein
MMFYPVVWRELRSYGYPNSLIFPFQCGAKELLKVSQPCVEPLIYWRLSHNPMMFDGYLIYIV